ncbi:MAG: hypothetical protein ACSHXD_18510, partial [Marinosulfonomonas sp.]
MPRSLILDALEHEALHAFTAHARVWALKLLGESDGFFVTQTEVAGGQSIEFNIKKYEIWCGREDSNFHGCYPTATSTLRVYQF